MSSQSSQLDERRDEIDLAQYFRIIWRYRIGILLVTLLSGVGAFWVASRETPMYQATMRVYIPSAQTEGVNPQLARFKALLDNTMLAQQILKEFALDKPPFRISAYSFLKGTITKTDVGSGTNMLDVNAILPDPVLAANVVNRYVDMTRDLVDRLSRDQNAASRDLLKAQVDEVHQRLSEAETALHQFKNGAQLELVRKDVGALLDERGRLVTLTINLEAERARLAEAERELAKQERMTAGRSALWQGSAVDAPATPSQQLRPEVLSPYINPVYQLLEQQIAMSRTMLAGLEKQRDELVGKLKLNAPQLAALSQLYQKEAEQARLETQVGLHQNVFGGLSAAYEQARLQVAMPIMSVQVVDVATPPESSITPGPMRRTEIASAVGLVLSMFGALFFDYIIRIRSRALPLGMSGGERQNSE